MYKLIGKVRPENIIDSLPRFSRTRNESFARSFPLENFHGNSPPSSKRFRLIGKPTAENSAAVHRTGNALEYLERKPEVSMESTSSF